MTITKHQVADEIRRLLTENSMTLVVVKSFYDFDPEPNVSIRLVSKSNVNDSPLQLRKEPCIVEL